MTSSKTKIDLKKILFFISFYSLFFISIQLMYRIKIFNQIKEVYREYSSLSFLNYLSFSINQDIILFLLVLLISTVLLFRFTTRVKIINAINLFILWIISIGFLVGIDFFRVYETTFQTNFLTTENKTGLAELLNSSFAESSTFFWVMIFVFTAILIVAFIFSNWILKRKSENLFFPIKQLSIFLSATLLFSLILLLAINPTNRISTFLKSQKNINNQSNIATLKELSLNPISNIFSFKKEQPSYKKISTKFNDKKFTFGLNTDSLISRKRYPRINSIPHNKKYNIILYFFESTAARYIHEKINGKVVTPNFNNFAKHSIVPTKHYTNYPLSENAMLSVFASAYDAPTKANIIETYPKIKLKIIAQRLKAAGYATCFIHTGGLGYARQDKFLKNRGYDEILQFKDLKKEKKFNKQVGWGIDERAMLAPTIRFIKKHKDKPYFISMFPVNPHHPYAIPNNKFRITGKIPKNISKKKKNWLNYLNSLYFADYAMGYIIKGLEKRGLLKNTIVFMFADHGEAFYQHRRNYNHPFYIYEENVHVPLLIYNKDLIKKEIKLNAVTRHIDFLPTILDLIGLKKTPEEEGISMLSARKEQLVLLHTFWRDDFMGIRDGKWKYIRKMKSGHEELYNLDRDPLEKKNIADKFPNIVKKYREYIFSARAYKKGYYKKMLGNKKKKLAKKR